ncbi:MAG: thymidine phosphorylase [bacterium]
MSIFRAVDSIIRKRDGGRLEGEEIEAFIREYSRGGIPDYQATALLMAILFRGMDFDEIAALTDSMMRSGEVYDLSLVTGMPAVDKHSTGGVGDKVSLALAPLAAACGVAVPMVSGRGLGHTGGTLDKLEAIPGFRVHLGRDEFMRQIAGIGVVMCGQSSTFVPADRKLYALRDVTGTVESIPLICASILSKKLASGAQGIVMDVKAGSGAFMSSHKDAWLLADSLIRVAGRLGRPARALMTDMSQPLGRAIGNSLETIEAIECLRGGGPADLRTLTIELTAEMIVLARNIESGAPTELGRQAALETSVRHLESGAAWEKFRQLVQAQGGDLATIDDVRRFDVAPDIEDFKLGLEGYLASMNCREIGNAAMVLGAGRLKVSDSVDHGVGLEMLARIGDHVKPDQPLLRIRHRGGRGLDDCRRRLAAAFQLSDAPAAAPPLVHGRLG